MTKRLYYSSDPYACKASVLSCEKEENGFVVRLDRTVIFPASGGQLSDTGKIGDASVIGASEDGDDVLHLVDRALGVGQTVSVCADEGTRRAHSEQHTGEHILSGLLSSMFGATNVGFHMAKDYCTIDTDIFIDPEQLEALEREANRAVRRNLPVTYSTVDEEALKAVQIRKAAVGLTGEVRIVFIGDVDSCTCCGTHCGTSGEVGFIAVTDSMKYKSGTRIWFACGERAVGDAAANRHIARALGKRFSTNRDEIIAAVQKQGDELNAMRQTLKRRTDELLAFRAKELMELCEKMGGTHVIVRFEEGLSMQELKLLADKLIATPDTQAVLFGKESDRMIYQLANTKGSRLSSRELCLTLNAMLGGKGGGRDDFAQGSAKLPTNIPQTMEQLTEYLRKALR